MMVKTLHNMVQCRPLVRTQLLRRKAVEWLFVL
jgi:hypothetical protein